jgi:putative addiction module component (TIGR02574 family)
MVAITELKKLPIAERMQLVEELWDSIEKEQNSLPDSPEVVGELRARYTDYMADPTSVIPWETAFKLIRSKRE